MADSDSNASDDGKKPVRECEKCSKTVQSVKVLVCKHTLCASCVEKVASGSVIKCPECRTDTRSSNGVHQLPTRHFGCMECDFCSAAHDTEDVWWCPTCIQIVCNDCELKAHRKMRHDTFEWDSLKAVEDIQAVLHCHHATSDLLKMPVMRALVSTFGLCTKDPIKGESLVLYPNNTMDLMRLTKIVTKALVLAGTLSPLKYNEPFPFFAQKSINSSTKRNVPTAKDYMDSVGKLENGAASNHGASNTRPRHVRAAPPPPLKPKPGTSAQVELENRLPFTSVQDLPAPETYEESEHF